ncbi:hypothetical protein JN757_07970 [Pseudomonas granadensis]|uniref:Uncharacterized protein n=1 Tax=Pseudomonas granadensis TaxID=1421430 RepID=A0ABX7GK08_9PSED|nr:hypothetical protein [Pseudomonas granadensis]QRK85695.1 hypothetical protein JN757_07970 [Pseudomonas granadensis]
MRYMKLGYQVRLEGVANVESRIVEFHDRAEDKVVYKASISRFGHVQRLQSDEADRDGLTASIERFLAKTCSDMQSMFDNHHRADQNGKSMELLAEAGSVRVGFFAADGKKQHEMLITPETRQEKSKRLEREAQRWKEVVQEAKRRGVPPPPVCKTLDRGFMDRLCEAYVKLGW